MKTIFSFALLILLLEACSSVPRFTSNRNRTNVKINNNEDLSSYKNLPVLETQKGIASFYADKYHGKITYGGEEYDMYGISAAHPTYPMNTIVRVTNIENGKNIILRINDKMPFREDRIIDLSFGAAQTLGFVNDGLKEVKIEVLKWGEEK